jgi:hypothetical protein
MRGRGCYFKLKKQKLFVLLLVTILSQTLFAFVGSNLMSFSFFTTGHNSIRFTSIKKSGFYRVLKNYASSTNRFPGRLRCQGFFNISILFFSSFFITKLLICDDGYKYANVKRWSKKIDIFEMDKIFGFFAERLRTRRRKLEM